MAVVFADCCSDDKVEKAKQSNQVSNCTLYPDNQTDLGNKIPAQFKGPHGIQMEDYFSDKLNAKGKIFRAV